MNKYFVILYKKSDGRLYNNFLSIWNIILENYKIKYLNLNNKKEIINLAKEIYKNKNDLYLIGINEFITLQQLKFLLNKDNVIIGGTITKYLNNYKNLYRDDLFSFLNIPFDINYYSFENLLSKINYVTLPYYHCGCYWDKCIFCDHNKLNFSKYCNNKLLEKYLEKTIEINKQKRKIFINISSVAIPQLKIIKNLNSNINFPIKLYIRTDKEILEFLEKNYFDMSNIEFYIGIENFIDDYRNFLNKKMDWNIFLKFLTILNEYNAKINISIISLGYPFYKEKYKEELLKKIEEINNLKIKNLIISENGYLRLFYKSCENSIFINIFGDRKYYICKKYDKYLLEFEKILKNNLNYLNYFDNDEKQYRNFIKNEI